MFGWRSPCGVRRRAMVKCDRRLNTSIRPRGCVFVGSIVPGSTFNSSIVSVLDYYTTLCLVFLPVVSIIYRQQYVTPNYVWTSNTMERDWEGNSSLPYDSNNDQEPAQNVLFKNIEHILFYGWRNGTMYRYTLVSSQIGSTWVKWWLPFIYHSSVRIPLYRTSLLLGLR